MTKQDKTVTKLTTDEKLESRIKGMFYMIQSSTEKFLEELERSYELYKIGEKTEIAKRLEEIATGQKVGAMETELIGKLLNTLHVLGKKVVVDGFLKNTDAIKTAFLLSEDDNRILYGVVPQEGKEDELRKTINSFYSQTSNWEMFRYTEPLFQVIPQNLVDKITYKSSIK